MSVDRYNPHILILPEDDANRQLANGFLLEVDYERQRRMQVLNVAGGWRNVIGSFCADHIAEMDRLTNRLMVLLIDFDGKTERLETVKEAIPNHLVGRVFVLGFWGEPEDLKAALGRPYETIGSALATDCRDETNANWGHHLLRHNAAELERLLKQVRPILF